jgi:hypothetical protein
VDPVRQAASAAWESPRKRTSERNDIGGRPWSAVMLAGTSIAATGRVRYGAATRGPNSITLRVPGRAALGTTTPGNIVRIRAVGDELFGADAELTCGLKRDLRQPVEGHLERPRPGAHRRYLLAPAQLGVAHELG